MQCCCRNKSRDRGRGDDVSTLAMLLDQRPENLDPPDGRHQVDAHRPVPRRLGPGAIRPAAADARVVDEDMHLAVAGDRGCAAAASSALSETSAFTPSTSTLVSLSCSSAAARASSSMSQSMTFAPAWAKAVAIPRPMPDAAPVTNAVFPASSFMRLLPRASVLRSSRPRPVLRIGVKVNLETCAAATYGLGLVIRWPQGAGGCPP